LLQALTHPELLRLLLLLLVVLLVVQAPPTHLSKEFSPLQSAS